MEKLTFEAHETSSEMHENWWDMIEGDYRYEIDNEVKYGETHITFHVF